MILDPPAAAEKRSRIRAVVRHPLFPLALITVLGATLRFMLLWRPALWIDEAAVYRRVCGTFADTMERVADSGFTPLHYVLYWAIKQIATMTPFVMRLPTAIAGTAMVPVMYWLARQVVPSRATAMLVALFTACGAYVLGYSRDAKMYVECWTFVALSTACLLWWLGNRRWVAWSCWAASGAVMLGLHGTAAMVLPVQAIIFLTHSKLHWKRAILFVVAVFLIVSPTVIYYTRFNDYPERIRNDWESSGLSWIEAVNGQRDALPVLRQTGATFLTSWEWPLPHEARSIDRRVLENCTTSALVMFAVIAVGVLPWRRPDPSAPSVPWRAMLWVTAWLVLPAYGVYCASTQDAWPPWAWFSVTGEYPYWIAAAGAITVFALWFRSADLRHALRKLAIISSVAAALFVLCIGVYYVTPTQPSSVWMPRYLGVVWPAFAIAVCALLMRLPTRPIRWAAIAVVIIPNLARHGAFIGGVWCEPPTERIATDVLAARGGADAATRTYLGLRNRFLMGPADQFFTPVLPYYLYALGGSTVRPMAYPTQWTREFEVRTLAFPSSVMAPPDLARAAPPATLKRIIIWHEWAPLQPGARDALLIKLGLDWKFVGEETWNVWDRWNWRKNYRIGRREYERH
jgi:hypothetical protein